MKINGLSLWYCHDYFIVNKEAHLITRSPEFPESEDCSIGGEALKYAVAGSRESTLGPNPAGGCD